MSAVFFSSRWVERPAHVTERPGGLAPGFRAAGVACGLKPSGATDLGLLVSDGPDTTSAARFTRSGAPAAPVLLCQDRCRLEALRVIAANSGCANAATGRRGLDHAAKMQGAAAMAAGVGEDLVAVASTGSSWAIPPVDDVVRGIGAARGELREDGGDDFADAIQTTDRFPKRAVANSPLVKAALHGGDPNWGRIAQSVGMAVPGGPVPFDIAIEGIPVCSAGQAIPVDQAALDTAVQGSEIEYEIGLPGDGAETEVFFSDLSHEYVTVNADYTT